LQCRAGFYTDGRKHPPAEDLLPTWEGHSIDPKTYVRPFLNTIYMERRPDLDVQEYYCSDNTRTKDEGH